MLLSGLSQQLISFYVDKDKKKRYAAGHERIRTYNEPDDRVVCHKTGNKYSYRETMGSGDISKLIEDVHAKK